MATATSIVRSPAALLFAKVTVSDHKPTPTIQISRFPSKRSCFTALLSSLHDNNDDDDNNNNNNVISHPKPLSSSQLFNSVSNGSRLRVAYQGVRGAYSEAAAEKAYPNCETVPCDQFDSAFQAVEKWLVDRAVLPIENSLGGSIHRNYDLLLRHSLHIVGEVKLAVQHCLVANHGVQLEDLSRVLSHPQALAQCENTLTKIGLSREAVDDTALAAKHVALHKLKDTGAVASSSAAKIYGLNILAQNIQDDCDNVTRFLILAREPIIPGIQNPFKTSIVFSLEEGPGVLFKALAIESRPLRNQPLRAADDNNGSKYFDYLFYVDFEASMAEERAQNALRHLKDPGRVFVIEIRHWFGFETAAVDSQAIALQGNVGNVSLWL
ncbi:Arogenate dehydratase/prephenate dehydratase 2, chloroplastic -like protein [Gossypium arboreum]|uniref:arogenate dehydratase n=1 Tax=Gossypium arboreum TaxID=29729 RepID=A0A0B0N2J2_GOSAR|nr:Arogenate dehydratase/prephenate dehydratase 2, chloroplastic -like protein [Gossypium arboreum]KHG17899.1 Arogenate dehydratase/prephenate dehydratase 2, chloroplastic -like protein [Gossypium arboreum]